MVEEVGPYDGVDEAGLVLEGNKAGDLGYTGSLFYKDYAGDCNTLAVLEFAVLCG